MTNFTYYGKTIPIPKINDIIKVEDWGFNVYYILITKIKLDKGKDGYVYEGYRLQQLDKQTNKPMIGFAPFLIKQRDDLILTEEAKKGKILKIYPKHRDKIIKIDILFS